MKIVTLSPSVVIFLSVQGRLTLFFVKSYWSAADPVHNAGEADGQGKCGKDQKERGRARDHAIEESPRKRALNPLLCSEKNWL